MKTVLNVSTREELDLKPYTKTQVEREIAKVNRNHLTLNDVDDIVELDRIASRIQDACDDYEEVKDYFRIGDKFYQKPSFAQIALIEKIQEVYRNPALQELGVLYALDCERTPEELGQVPKRSKLIAYRFQVKAPQ